MLARRVAAVADYRNRFAAAGVSEAIHFADIATAISAFIGEEFSATNSPYDRFILGDATALDEDERRGMEIFNGKAGCNECHSGRFQTDHMFHSISLPQFGPGKGGVRYFWGDDGRAAVSGDLSDLFRFRTPSLRNVILTAPYGHNGAYSELEDMVRHHLDPIRGLALYDLDKAALPAMTNAKDDDIALLDFEENLRIAASSDLTPRELSTDEFADLMAFLGTLTDPKFIDVAHIVPEQVPSGLPLD